MRIVGLFHITQTNAKNFYEEVNKTVKQLQYDGQEIEIQYQPCSLVNGEVVFTALIIGRK